MVIKKTPVDFDVVNEGLKYYIFDWDDNILHMPTCILLERKMEDGAWEPCEVSTSLFALIRNDTENYRPPGDDWESAFVNFRDLKPVESSTFLTDTKNALAPIIAGEEKGAPSFFRFKKALMEGRIFGIVTARGHKPESIRKGVEYFIAEAMSSDERAKMFSSLRGFLHHWEQFDEMALSDDELLDYYLSLNKYHGVTSPEFKALMGKDGPGSENPEEAKQFAIKDFVFHVISLVRKGGVDKPISIGFSDDDPGNLVAAESYIREVLAKEFPEIKFVVYDTSDRDVPRGRKIIIQGQMELGLDTL